MGVPNGVLSFPQLCLDGCSYTKQRDAPAEGDDDVQGNDVDELVGVVAEQSGPADSSRNANELSNTGSLVGTGQQEGGTAGWQNQCGKNCTSVADCSVPSGGSGTCSCLAHTSQYQPGSGTVAFIAACLVTLGSGGGKKRDEMPPCPCNSTYVSHGCCAAPSGLVWEPPDSKLGQLLMDP